MKLALVSFYYARQNISKIAVSVNTARQVNTAHSKTTVNAARNIVRGKNVNTTRLKAVVNVVHGNNVNVVKASACWADPKHMTENMSYLTDDETIDEGSRCFWREPQRRENHRKRFTWVFFLATKDETSGILKVPYITGIRNILVRITRLSVARTPQQNGVAERRNRTLIEAVRTMLADSKLPTTFWAEAVNTACYVSVTILNTIDHLGKFDGTQSNGFTGTKASDNAVNVVGGKTSIELPDDPNMTTLKDISIFDFTRNDEDDGVVANMNNLDTTIQVSPIPTTRIHKDHPLDQKVWTLVDLPNEKRAIGTKWVFRNKRDEKGIVIRNKARLIAQRYTQEEGIDYDKVFAPVARIEAIRLFLVYASFKDFVVYQMDVKSAFLYGMIEEEVYVCQPPGFEDPDFPDKVYKVEKALYGLRTSS
ncbi:retrovirus-related pol polyprotein from transposon TNT 1-94 [Tanacetum coccineum]